MGGKKFNSEESKDQRDMQFGENYISPVRQGRLRLFVS